MSLVDEWSRYLDKRRTRPFLQAAMGAAALVANADRDVRLSEQLALDRIVERLDELRLHGPHSCVDLHRSWVEALESDAVKGASDVLEAVAPFSDDEHRALLLIYVGVVVARADGELSEAELGAVHDLCRALDLDPDTAVERIWPAT